MSVSSSFSPAREAKPHTIRVTVKTNQTGRLWLLEGRYGQVTIQFKGQGASIPPCFATDPELFFLP